MYSTRGHEGAKETIKLFDIFTAVIK